MDLRQLNALVAVADHGTFSAAAQALHTVQSNVSGHVAHLEKELGVELFDRYHGTLTEAGEMVVSRARLVQGELAALRADLDAARGEVSGVVRVGVIASVARQLVPALLRAARERHPDTRTIVVEASTTSLAPQVINGALDLAVVNIPLSHPDLVTELLFDEPLVVAGPPGHPLADRAQLSLSDVASYPLVLPPVGTALRDEIDGAAFRAGVELQPEVELDGIRLMSLLVFEGFGTAILPSSAIASWTPGAWWAARLTDAPDRHVGLTRARRSRPTAAAEALANILREITMDFGVLRTTLDPNT